MATFPAVEAYLDALGRRRCRFSYCALDCALDESGRRLTRRAPQLPVVVLPDAEDLQQIRAAIDSGAGGIFRPITNWRWPWRHFALSDRGYLWKGDNTLTVNSVPSDFVGHAGRMRRAATFRGVLPIYGRPVGGALKRAIDVAGSLLLIVLLAPLFVCTMVLIRLIVGGPVIFRHRRVGVGGTRFDCYKFRTMVTDGDKVLERYLASNPDAAGEWKRTRKLRDDPRVCSFAKILRKSSLDELPQLFNVLRGDMSLVGPRPIVDDEIRHYGSHFEECFRSRPGLSGLWQVSGRNGVSYERRVALDRYYARRWSIWLDMRILLKTVATVFSFHQTS